MKWIVAAFILVISAGISGGEGEKKTLDEISKELSNQKTLDEISKELSNQKAELIRLREERENQKAELQEQKTELQEQKTENNKQKNEIVRLHDEAEKHKYKRQRAQLEAPHVADVLIEETRKVCGKEILSYHRGEVQISFEGDGFHVSRADATSNRYNEIEYQAEQAFKRQIFFSPLEQTMPWIPNDAFPQTVFFLFPDAINVTKFSFRSRAEDFIKYPQYADYIKQSPTDFDFVASNDCLTWTTIIEKRGVTWTTFDERQEWVIPREKRSPFVCYGITVLQDGYSGRQQEPDANQARGAIQDVNMWKSVEPNDTRKMLELIDSEVRRLRPESPIAWRSDNRCGTRFLVNGRPTWCNPFGNKTCCSEQGYCGSEPHFCGCLWKPNHKCDDYSTYLAYSVHSNGLAPIKEAGEAGSTHAASREEGAAYAFMNVPRRFWRGTDSYPQFVWFHFSTPHTLAGIGFSNHERAPKDFQVMGSNDCSNWTPLLEAENRGYPNNYEQSIFKFWHIRESRVPYGCFGLKIYSVSFGDVPEVRNVVFYEVKKNRFLLQQQKDDMGHKAPIPV